MKIEILKVDDDKVCIDFTKIDGDYMSFVKEFNALKAYLGCHLEQEALEG